MSDPAPPPNSIPIKSVSHEDLKKAFAEWLADLPDGETLFRPGEHQPEVYADALWDRLN